MGERRRARPGRVTHPITENATAVIDKSFDILFRDLEVLTDSTPVSRGGTGLAGYAKGDLLYASGVDVLATLAITTTAGRFLRSDGALPEWSALVLPNASVTGDLLYASGTNVIGALADIATGNALLSGGIGVAPAWGKIGLTTHVTGTLPAANGGTGIASYTIGDLLYASGTTSLAARAAVAVGQVLVSNGTGAAPVYSADPQVTTLKLDTLLLLSSAAPTISSGFGTNPSV